MAKERQLRSGIDIKHIKIRKPEGQVMDIIPGPVESDVSLFANLNLMERLT